MKVCYRKSDGVYCDSADSYVKYPGDIEFIKGINVMGRFGGSVEDYAVIETNEKQPYLKRYISSELVDDTEKIEQIANYKSPEEILRQEQIEFLKTATDSQKMNFLLEQHGLKE